MRHQDPFGRLPCADPELEDRTVRPGHGRPYDLHLERVVIMDLGTDRAGIRIRIPGHTVPGQVAVLTGRRATCIDLLGRPTTFLLTKRSFARLRRSYVHRRRRRLGSHPDL
jgi:hypothetical protein